MGLFKRKNNKNLEDNVIVVCEEVENKESENKEDVNTLDITENIYEDKKEEKQSESKFVSDITFKEAFNLHFIPLTLSVFSVVSVLISLFIAYCGGVTGAIVFRCIAITFTIAALTTLFVKEVLNKKLAPDLRYAFVVFSIIVILL